MTKIKKMSFRSKFLLAVACVLALSFGAGAAFATNESNDDLGLLVNDAPYEASFAVEVDPCEDVVVFDSGEKTELTASAADADGNAIDAMYQWQVLADEDSELWVNVQGQDDETVGLTFGMLNGVLGDGDVAQVRCVATSDGESAASDAIEVTVLPATGAAEAAGETPMRFASPRMSAASDDPNAGISLAAEEGAEVPATYTIMIEYVFTNGEQAAYPWTATVPAGSAFSETVKSPSVLGYTPDSSSVSWDIPAVSQPETYEVVYYPALVGFTVNHHKQNVADDGYALAEFVEKTGYTEDPVGEGLEKEYEGFYALLYDEATEIAADGSTVVDIKYDRYYYLMSFDLDGGYGVEPIYARYGADVSAGVPTKAGYVFAGWKDVSTGTVYTSADFPYDTMPAENTKFVAQWTAQSTTFDVVYWYENADDDGYSQAGVRNDVSATSGSRVNGSDYKDHSFDGRDDEHFTFSHADTNVVVKGDGTTVVNVYFTRNVYTLTFVMGGWAGSCSLATHQHGDSCKEFACELDEHNHGTTGCQIACSHSSHELDCYQTRSDYTLKSATPGRDIATNGDGVYSYDEYWSTHYYLYLDGNWYCYYRNYNNNKSDTQSISLDCKHVHTDACYSCGETAHAHNDGCYELICGKDAHYHSGNTCHLVVTAKYDSDITYVWESNPVKGVIDGGYVFESSATGDYYSFLEKMPDGNITLTKASFNGSSKYTWYYYLEVLPGQDTDGLALNASGGKTYYLYHTSSVYASNLSLTYAEDYFPITGFTQRDSEVPSFSNRQAYLYYTRNTYDLTFSNAGAVVAGEGGEFMYQADISAEDFVPAYPSNLEPDAYVFDGWYTSPFYGDTRFEFTSVVDGETVNATMPANDLTLYAKWVPTEHDVKLFLTAEDAAAGSDQIGATETVAHRETATEPNDPERGEYVFVGWFYMDGTTEKAFDFSMPVTEDLNLYAKWSSNKLMEYTVKFAVENEDGSLTYIAEDVTGSALAGTTKTFEAKAGSGLYDLSGTGGENYQVGYYPTTNSHSLTIDIEDAAKNTYIFMYVPATELDYVVRYLEFDGDYIYDGTEKVLHDPKAGVTKSAIITETFEPVTGYMPDAYQKKLILSADEEQNVVIFWYTKDEVHAPVQVIHYVQNIEGDGYTPYQESTDLNGVIDAEYSTDVINIAGFDYDHATANGKAVEATQQGKVTAKVGEGGLLLELYYNRELHPYEFRFLEQGTDKVLADPVTGEARYESQVTQNARDIDGYRLVSESSRAIRIQIESGDVAEKNVRTFYYVEDEATFEYVVVGPEGSGTVAVGSATSSDMLSETVRVLTGSASGSTATAAAGYKFVGWYSDEACTVLVSTEETYVPSKVGGKYSSMTYYAKFDYDLTTLTITKTLADGSTAAAGETFLFKVYEVDADGFGQGQLVNEVVIAGAGSVTLDGLVVGKTYRVVEDAAWSWRYDEIAVSDSDPSTADGTVKLAPKGNEVTFENGKTVTKWLDYSDWCRNVFKDSGVVVTPEGKR